MLRRISTKKAAYKAFGFMVFSIAVVALVLARQNSAQAFPTNQTILDNFNRSNGTISNSTASSGATWGAGIFFTQNSADVNSNQASTPASYAAEYIDSSTYGPDTEVYATISNNGGVTAGNEIVIIMARLTSPTTSSVSGYGIQVDAGTSGNLHFWKADNNSQGFICSALTQNPTPANGDKIGMSVTGTTDPVLEMWYDSGGGWVSKGTCTDTGAAAKYQGAGNVGLEVGNTTGIRIDDFGGGTVNTTPAAPTLSSPTAGEIAVSTTPQFQFRTTDAENDYLRYKIEVCSTSNCSSIVRTIDQTASQTGWTGQDTQSNTAYVGNSVISSSTMASHTYQATALSANTQYWWRAYAIDPGGANVFSTASSIRTFTTGSFPHTGVLDDFNRANLGNLGASWTNDTIGLSSSHFSIDTNRASNNNSAYGESWWNPGTFGPDSEAYFSIAQMPDGSNSAFGFMIRTQSPGNNGTVDGYRFEHLPATNTANIIEMTNGTETILASTSNTAAANDRYGMQAYGSTISIYKYTGSAWTILLSYTDGSAPIYNSAGYIGMWAYNGAGATQPAILDDFGGGTISSGASPAAPTLVYPASGASAVSNLPIFQLRTTDADNDYLKYFIQLYDAASCGGSQVGSDIDQTVSQTNWQGQDASSGTAYIGSSSIGGSTIARYQYTGTALLSNHTYSWRAKAIDPGGTNTFGSLTSCSSFTTGSSAVEINGGTEIRGGTTVQ